MMSLPTVRFVLPDRAAGAARALSRSVPGGVCRAGGFTVIELMVTVMILAIIVALGAPAMGSFVVQSRMTSQINELLADVSYARAEAATRGVRIGFCASTNTTTSAPSCSGSTGDWTNGRIVFVDTNGNGQLDTSSGEYLLKVSAPLGGSSTLTISQSGSSSPPAAFEFRPYGGIATPASGSTTYSSINGASANAQVSFKLCPNTTGVQGRQLDIALTGRPNVYKVGC